MAHLFPAQLWLGINRKSGERREVRGVPCGYRTSHRWIKVTSNLKDFRTVVACVSHCRMRLSLKPGASWVKTSHWRVYRLTDLCHLQDGLYEGRRKPNVQRLKSGALQSYCLHSNPNAACRGTAFMCCMNLDSYLASGRLFNLFLPQFPHS